MRPRPDEEAADRWLRARRIDLYWKAPGDRTAVALAAEEGNLRMRIFWVRKKVAPSERHLEATC